MIDLATVATPATPLLPAGRQIKTLCAERRQRAGGGLRVPVLNHAKARIWSALHHFSSAPVLPTGSGVASASRSPFSLQEAFEP